ncbi:MAG: sensor histidine kinase [Chitinophagales bacterium]|nr:sensor histidine kinase [Chitinophagales bacterium]
MKNLKPRSVALYISLAVAALTILLAYAFDEYQVKPVLHYLLIFVSVFIFSNYLFYYALERFIYRKIKLIYKTIHSLKLDRFTSDILGKSVREDDPVSEAEAEVIQWAENRSREIESLKKAEQYRKEFLSNLSHEIKTPLFSIQGYIHTLLDGAMDDKEVEKHFLEKSASSIERLSNLINDLEEISKLESGDVKLEKETFDMHSLTKDVFEEFEFRAATKKIRFSVKKGCERPFYVWADKERTRQVLTNLVDNSIKYGKENGNTVASFYEMGDNILTEVTDDGLGITEESLPRLFERFYRVDKSRSREQGGTGLGLAIVKHLIEAHGQTINVRSKKGVGSTFGFTMAKAEK